MSSFNKVIMAGNLTRDPEYKQIGGQGLCRLGLASNRQYKNKQSGSIVQEVCFVDVDVWGPQAEPCNQYLKKGKPVLIEGRLKFDSWKDNEGQTRSKHIIVADKVVFLSSPNQMDDIENQQESGLDREVLEKLNDIKKSKEMASDEVVGSVASSRSRKKRSDDSSDLGDSSEVDFKDEAPFADDLPF